MRKPSPGYEKEYVDKVKTLDVMYYAPFEELQGYMNGKNPKEITQYFDRLERCTCGGQPKVKQVEGMGELDTIITCKACGRSIHQSEYDQENNDDPGCEELALQKWNAGMTQEEINRIKAEKWEKKRLHEEDLMWHPLHPNNMPNNGTEGLYCLIFKKLGNNVYACKWTIAYQFEEEAPMRISSDSPVEAYILHMKRYFDVKGPLKYPRPNNHRGDEIIRDIKRETRRTLHNADINDYGDFVRAYKTLEDAKTGALARCGWQGLNRETIIKKR